MRIIVEDDYGQSFALDDASIRSEAETAQVPYASGGDDGSVYYETEQTGRSIVTVVGVLSNPSPSPPGDDMLRLAWAVIRGDKDTALMLADEVQMRHLQGADFIPRFSIIEERDRLMRILQQVIGGAE